MKEISCIILSAGFSSRMKANHKALLPFANFQSMLEKVIDTFKMAGITKIFVVLGHNEDKIKKIVKKNDCIPVKNADFEKGMFSSVYSGISAIYAHDQNIEATFLVPVDAGLIKVTSILAILEQRKNNFKNLRNKSLIIPLFLDKCGHPPLILKKHFEPIIKYYENSLKSNHNQGLRGYFASFLTEDAKKLFLANEDAHSLFKSTNEIDFFPLPDAGIISDIDTDEDYEDSLKFLMQTKNRKNPDSYECLHLLFYADLPKRTKKHCLKIGLGALRLGIAIKNLNNPKYDFNILYCLWAGLLHDICRTQKKHAGVGAAYLDKFGWNLVADIVASHTNLPSQVLEKINIFLEEEKLDMKKNSIKNIDELVNDSDYLYPAICVYLADKFYASDEHISMDQRFINIKERFVGDQKALNAIAKRQNVSEAVDKYFFELVGKSAYELVENKTDDQHEILFLDVLEKYAHGFDL